MTDLEMTKLCAEAMELPTPYEDRGGMLYCGSHMAPGFGGANTGRMTGGLRYWPLHDDAQAMALVKKLGLCATYPPDYVGDVWFVESRDMKINAESKDLNRAIVECAAKLQADNKSFDQPHHGH